MIRRFEHRPKVVGKVHVREGGVEPVHEVAYRLGLAMAPLPSQDLRPINCLLLVLGSIDHLGLPQDFRANMPSLDMARDVPEVMNGAKLRLGIGPDPA